MTLTELRDALAKATGPDRKLDHAILEACTEWRLRFVETGLTDALYRDKDRPERVLIGREVLRYTASIDAAVTLVPDGHWFNINNQGIAAAVFSDINFRIVCEAYADTIPLALCLARCEYEITRQKEIGAEAVISRSRTCS